MMVSSEVQPVPTIQQCIDAFNKGAATAVAAMCAVGTGDGSKMTKVEKMLYYLNKAEEVRVIAQDARSEANKQFLMGVAADYLRMAEAVERMTEDPGRDRL